MLNDSWNIAIIQTPHSNDSIIQTPHSNDSINTTLLTELYLTRSKWSEFLTMPINWDGHLYIAIQNSIYRTVFIQHDSYKVKDNLTILFETNGLLVQQQLEPINAEHFLLEINTINSKYTELLDKHESTLKMKSAFETAAMDLRIELNSLYDKFAKILNSKKLRIRALQNSLE
jgi:hypothetical protein